MTLVSRRRSYRHTKRDVDCLRVGAIPERLIGVSAPGVKPASRRRRPVAIAVVAGAVLGAAVATVLWALGSATVERKAPDLLDTYR